MNILQITSSLRGAESESTRVATSIVERLLAANPGAQVVARDLARVDTDASIAFCCVRSLDLASQEAQRTMLAWLDARIGRPGARPG